MDKTTLSKSSIDNIITEIKLLKILKHEHVVEMRDFFWDDKRIYIVMEYCDGGDLSDFIKKRRRLPENICKKFLQQLAQALRFLRSHNVCHMDLKPQNLLLARKPKIVLKVGGAFDRLNRLCVPRYNIGSFQTLVSRSIWQVTNSVAPCEDLLFTWRLRYCSIINTTPELICGASVSSLTNACSARRRIPVAAFRSLLRR